MPRREGMFHGGKQPAANDDNFIVGDSVVERMGSWHGPKDLLSRILLP